MATPFDWGSFAWGDAAWGAGDIGATKLLRFCREGPNFRALADIIDKRQGAVFAIVYALLISYDLDRDQDLPDIAVCSVGNGVQDRPSTELCC